MDDVVLAPFDTASLDVEGSPVRIRLDSTCVQVRNAGNGVELAYIRDGKLHRVAAAHAVLACFHMVIPYIMRSCRKASAALAEEHQKRHWFTPTCSCATGMPGRSSACTRSSPMSITAASSSTIP